MKKLLTAILLLMGIIIYLVVQISKLELYLPEFYIYDQNPVSFHWNYIGIETGYKKGDPDSIHQIWITPLYFVLLAVFILVISAFLKKK
ncbi:hypothetical protein P9160_01795 [Bacillus halotolerans]|uniref:hypothetical protein n=1 Tax=Bacillus halotolerans TaxID=260554 RepID=UPI002DB84F99|nr:hypothetical protein [Bacillus halotolerans]MEC3756157.1 hypothetical protein [Bacillus halotolerans]